jgi:hypothetical protein
MWPQLTNINPEIVNRIKQTDSIETSKLNCFVRIISGAGNGLVMSSNPDWKLFSAAGVAQASFYGDSTNSGTIGMSWDGKPVYAIDPTVLDTPYKPSPIVTAINVKEGKDQISRHCDLKLTAFTLAQVETLQAYLMEPGYSLLIEYGWNTDNGVSGLIPLNASTIVSDTGKFNLDQDTLHLRRIQCKGEYDSFFGFIVGGSVSSNGDVFDMSIKLRGAPGLPTYLQSQHSIEPIVNGKVSNKAASPPFGVSELNLEAADQRAERRFKKMYNELPKIRQTSFVKNMLFKTKDNIWTSADFVNFDPVVDNQISNWRDGRKVDGTEIKKEEIIQPKTKSSGQEADALKNDPQKEWELLNAIADGFMEFPFPNSPKWLAKIKANPTWTPQLISKAFETRLSGDKPKYNADFTRADFERANQNEKLIRLPNPPQPKPPTPPAATGTSGAAGTSGVAGAAGGQTVSNFTIDATEIMLDGGLPLPKEKLFSKNRYVRFAKVVSILNENSGIESIELAGRNVNVIIDITDVHIGAFKGIYSIKPEALIIPGLIPDFSKFFMEQNLTDLNEDTTPLINNSIYSISFAQPEALTGKHSEEPYYWGKLENLYINFELLKKELSDANKTMRDVLQSLLNEMSAAVDSFWNFQIVEKKAKVDGKDTTVYTVIDENWVGKNTSTPVQFVHSGEKSKFLQADLSIDIPGSMTSQIISKRLSLSSNPSQANIEVSAPNYPSIFNGKPDRFMTGYVKPNGVAENKGGTGTSGTSGTSGVEQTAAEKRLNKFQASTLTPAQQEQRQKLIDRDKANAELIKKGEGGPNATEAAALKLNNDKIAALNGNNVLQIVTLGMAPGTIEENNKQIDTIQAQQAEIEKRINARKAAIDAESKAIEEEIKTYEDQAKQQVVANISSNLEKIDVVPNPEENLLTEDVFANFLNSMDVFKAKFKVYCCTDKKYLNVLKQNAMSRRLSGGGRLSHPLPIKYSFTIMGKSGIRRGDTFNIIGIPRKYAACGLFQVTEVEQTIQDMKWNTRVQGEYRQQQ